MFVFNDSAVGTLCAINLCAISLTPCYTTNPPGSLTDAWFTPERLHPRGKLNKNVTNAWRSGGDEERSINRILINRTKYAVENECTQADIAGTLALGSQNIDINRLFDVGKRSRLMVELYAGQN